MSRQSVRERIERDVTDALARAETKGITRRPSKRPARRDGFGARWQEQLDRLERGEPAVEPEVEGDDDDLDLFLEYGAIPPPTREQQARDREREWAAAARCRRVVCEHCSAPPFHDCRSPSGYLAPFHVVRKQAAGVR